MNTNPNNEFMSVPNIVLCMDVFKAYMRERYGFDTTAPGLETKKKTYDVMVRIHESFKDDASVTLKEKNNMVLNAMRDKYKSAYGLGGGTKKSAAASSMSSASSADRHPSAVFGDRPMMTMQIKPEAVQRSTIKESTIQQMQMERQLQQQGPANNNNTMDRQDQPIKEHAFDLETFNDKLEHLRSARSSSGIASAAAATATVMDLGESTNNPQDTRLAQDREEFTKHVADTPHPKTIFEPFGAESSSAAAAGVQAEEVHLVNAAAAQVIPRSDFIAPPVTQTHIVEKYLIINGFDRDWNENHERFRVVADFNSFSENDLQSRHKNIRSIALKRVIIPQEIQECVSLGNIPKNSNFVHDFNFGFPYVLISIDEISDNYDGTNDAARRAFCPMIVDKHWRSRSGRGFLVLQCMQDERKTFYPTALSDIKRLTLTIRKPNGDIFNHSKDDYRLVKVEYEAYNPSYMKIVLNKYFDKNEFFKGDMVKMRGVKTSSQTLLEFLNRDSGHEIMESGQPNAQGYFKTFYIHGPGAFDAVSGRFVVDTEAIDVHEKYNDTLDFTDPGCVNGDVMNMTLQCVFSFKLEEVVVDPGAMMITA